MIIGNKLTGSNSFGSKMKMGSTIGEKLKQFSNVLKTGGAIYESGNKIANDLEKLRNG
jgi:hypothetical protein